MGERRKKEISKANKVAAEGQSDFDVSHSSPVARSVYLSQLSTYM